ncbi:unnamed protein product [Rotaria magnacalcarata]|nr:unnamed protein product [Rotaria magnacalcarata]CAF5041328.1 unnamed protein product [Rotaria magnacalcarata]
MHAAHHNPGQHGSYIDPVIRQNIWRQLVSIVQTLTSNDIVHMDLKPDNLILFGDTLKIIDLGISKKPEMIGQPGVGTPLFSAPEIMNPVDYRGQPYGPKADVWSLGAILYYMTYGEPPNYISGAANPPYHQKPSRDPNLVDVLRRTLVEDPHARIDIFSLLRHPYTTRHL